MALKLELGFYALIVFNFRFAVCTNGGQNDICYSRFDYESKMLERIVMVEHRMNLLHESTKQALVELKAAKEDMLNDVKIATKHLRSEIYERQTQMTNELSMRAEEMQNATNSKIEEMTDIGNAVSNTSKTLVEQQTVKHAQIEADVNNLTTVLQHDLMTRQEQIVKNLTAFAHTLEVYQNAALGEVGTAMKNMSELAEKLKEEQSVKLEAVEIIGNDIKVEIQEKMLKIETEDTRMEEKHEKTLEEFRRLVNSTWADIKGEGFGLKPAVVFNVIDVDVDVYSEVVYFTNVIVNTEGVYNTQTGYFNVPVNGTYMFAVQICGIQNNIANAQITVNDVTIIADVRMYDYDSNNSCTSSVAAALLEKGDTVSVKVGPGGLGIRSEEGKRCSFTGALVH